MDEAEQVEHYHKWEHTAFICTLIANKLRNAEEGPYAIDDFMPIALPGEMVKVAKKEQTQEEQLEIIKMYNAALGGNFIVN